MYHYTRDLTNSRYPNIKGMHVRLFRKQVEYLKHNFNVVTMEDVLDSISGRKKLKDNSVLLTFDDGYIDNYTFALPILEDLGVQGSFFIPGKTFVTHQLLDVNKIHFILACASECELLTDLKDKMSYYRGKEYDFPEVNELYEQYATPSRWDSKDIVFVKRMLQTVLPERLRNIISSELFEKYVGVPEERFAAELYMTEDQIRVMKNHGMHIGIHGYDHYWLANLPEEQMKNDINMALEALGEFIDRDAWVMCYPKGSYSQSVVDYIEKKGAKIGLTVNHGVADLSEDRALLLPRLDCNDFPPKSDKYKEYSN